MPPDASSRSKIAKLHRSAVADIDATFVGTLPVTSLARTLVDCAGIFNPQNLSSIVDTALNGRHLKPQHVVDALGRAGITKAGRAALLISLVPWTGSILPESPAEARLIRRLAQWELPKPVLQFVVKARTGSTIARLDAAWPSRLVGLEYDGVEFHGPRRIVADEERHANLTTLGWHIVHTDHLDLRPGDERLRLELAPLLR